MILIALFFICVCNIGKCRKISAIIVTPTIETYVKTTCIMSPIIPLCRSGYSEVSQIALKRHSLPGFPELQAERKIKKAHGDVSDGRTRRRGLFTLRFTIL